MIELTLLPNFSAMNWLAAFPAHGEIPDETLTIGIVLWRLFVIFFFVMLNAFFVASEFALVKVRPSQLDTEIEKGSRRSRFTRHVVEHLDAYLSATQLGITLASIALGWLGERYLSGLIKPLFTFFQIENEAVVSTSIFIIAFSGITYLHIVIGELMPKSLAIRKSLGTSLTVARPLDLFYKVFKPAIWFLNGTANWLLKILFKVDPITEAELVHSADELRMIVAESEKSREVTATEKEILINTLELNALVVRDIMTPRSDVICLDAEKSLEENLRIAQKSQHTRFPLAKDHLDSALGLIHVKDMVHLIGKPKADLISIKRELHVVPEMMTLDKLLQFFLNRHVHLALVVDEFGGAVGIVTLDNVLEELVGEIKDEFDVEDREFRKINDREYLVEGSLALYELEDHLGLTLENPDVSTIGGYVTHLIGHLPERGEKVQIGNYDVTVTQSDGRRVGRLLFHRLEEPISSESEGLASEFPA